MSTDLFLNDFSLGKFGDRRLDLVGVNLFKSICKKGSSIIKNLATNRAEQVQFNRFIWNEDVTIGKMQETAFKKTSKLAEECDHVLAIEDTTELNFNAHKNKVKDLGVVGNNTDIGLFFHPSLAIDVKDDFILGISALNYWDRDPNRDINANRKKKPIEEKESYRWIDNAMQSKKNLNKAKLITHVADRESDIFEFLYRVPDEKNHVLVRSQHNREIIVQSELGEKTDNLVNFINHLDVKFKYTVMLPARANKRSKHEALLEVKYSEIFIRKPSENNDKKAPEKIKITVIDVRENESTVVTGTKPVHWRLLTTHKVTNTEEAINVINYYRKRWNVEQLFRTMKSQGIKTEDSQLTTRESLIKMCFLCLISAAKILQLTICRDGKINRDGNKIFNERELNCMEILLKKYEGKTEKQKNPFKKRTIAWCHWLIARIGGWKGYIKSEGPAGPRTLKSGLEQFSNIFIGWELTFG